MKKVMKLLTPFLLAVITLAFAACTNRDAPYLVERQFTEQKQIDSLKTELITFVGVPPKRITGLARFQPKYKKHYIGFLPKYELDRYFVAEDSTHYFFMLRPARSPKANTQRGVGGKFKKNKRGRIVAFEEVYNTPIMEEDEIRKKGRELFIEMVETGTIAKYADDRSYVEWPDERLKYDQRTFEWRYTALK
jgi:hypothetical protein